MPRAFRVSASPKQPSRTCQFHVLRETRPMSMTVTLTIRDGEVVRAQQVGLGAHLVGRDPACSVVFTSPDVSRQHARITMAEKSFLVEDLGSTSGTAVNGGWLSSARRFTYPQ